MRVEIARDKPSKRKRGRPRHPDPVPRKPDLEKIKRALVEMKARPY